MEQIRDAFQKVRKDINTLYHELNSLKSELRETRQEMIKICEVIEQINEGIIQNKGKIPQKQQKDSSTHPHLNSTLSTHPSTHNLPLEVLKTQNMAISTGNQGVPTDRQTDRQTHAQQEKTLKIEENEEKPINSIENAAKILDSLDNIKKEIRLQFKRLTEQETLVFSTLYQVDEETGPTDYKTLAQRLDLTESSIRDYIGRLIKKGIPVEKKRINNKTIKLSISKNLKKIATLSTILQLRDL